MNSRSEAALDNIFYFLFVILPFSIAPLAYLAYRLNKSIKNIRFEATSSDYSQKKFIRKILLRQAGILLACGTIVLIVFASFAFKTHFIVKFLFLVLALPIFMVIVSLFAGLGKAFEAGFSSSTLLNTLDDIGKENKEKQKEIEEK